VAPIPGKSTVGIEIPNRHRDPVSLGEMTRLDPEFFSKSRDLSIVLGKDISGANIYVDLAKLPHLLIAGATGAGKSVYMNSAIASLLYTQSPEDVRFIMIDPKMVELKLYEGIPHLLMPVITDVKKASKALNWAVQEMEYRYTILSKARCRDIRSYNEKYSQSELFKGEEKRNKMPYIILLIDELADLMMVSAKDVEDSIIRLTQKARAVGIHVIMATQRPSVDVITALIKANCPARISFHVAQRTDSRTILDSNGAETLLGRGDMLYKSPVSTELKRIQAPLITEKEIEMIVSETRKFGDPSYIELDDEYGNDEEGADSIDEGLFNEAWAIIKESGKTSTSYIQRRLRIGYNRAANLIEVLERRGYISEAMGNRPREILRQE
jgi:S-DNA-T family DNA segregation ATPase FtsK/SpoIIIE